MAAAPARPLPGIQLPLLRSTSSPALGSPASPLRPSVPRGARRPAGSFSFHIPPSTPPSPGATGSSTRAALSHGATAAVQAAERINYVRFSADGASQRPVTPYSTVYGEHPRKFHFGRSGEKVPAEVDARTLQCGEPPSEARHRCRRTAVPSTPPSSPCSEGPVDSPESASLAGLETRLLRLAQVQQQQRTLSLLGASLVAARISSGHKDAPATTMKVLQAAKAAHREAVPRAACHPREMRKSSSMGSTAGWPRGPGRCEGADLAREGSLRPPEATDFFGRVARGAAGAPDN